MRDDTTPGDATADATTALQPTTHAMTPGPWVADEYGVITGNGCTRVAETHQVKWGLCAEQSGEPAKSRCLELAEQAKANACAIAAVPALVEALQEAVRVLYKLGCDPTGSYVSNIRAALKSAGVK